MKNRYILILLLTISLISFSSYSQTENEEPLLGLPGDDLDLYAVLDLFQKSKTIEDFEKALNAEKAGIVNLDLNNDGNADFIKVETKKDGDNFLFILQDPVSEKETQDVAVITVSKDAKDKVIMQIIGDEKLYGKDYVVEPRSKPTEGITANPAYAGVDPVTVNVQATTQVVVVETTPIVQYVYSPVYVPYVPPYYYGYYPPYWAPIAIVSIGIYRHNNYYHHSNYHGGYGNTNVVVHNHNNYNHYQNNTRNTSSTVNNNIKNGNFKTSGQSGSRPTTRPTTSNTASSANKASTTNRASTNNKTSSSSKTATSRPTTSNRTAYPNTSNKPSASRSMGSHSSYGGGRSSNGASAMSRAGGRRKH